MPRMSSTVAPRGDRARRDRGSRPRRRRACLGTTPGHADVFEVLLGHGDEPWDPPLDGPAPAPGSPLGPALASHLFLADVPVTITLGPGAVLGVAGPSSVTEAVARSLVIQLAVHHGPADLSVGIAVVPDRLDRWRWVEAPARRHGRLR